MHWKITALWGGKKVELLETERAVTPFRRFGGVLRISAADRLLRSGAGASAVFSPFSQCDRSGEDLHGIFAFSGSGSRSIKAWPPRLGKEQIPCYIPNQRRKRKTCRGKLKMFLVRRTYWRCGTCRLAFDDGKRRLLGQR